MDKGMLGGGGGRVDHQGNQEGEKRIALCVPAFVFFFLWHMYTEKDPICQEGDDTFISKQNIKLLKCVHLEKMHR